MQAPPTWLAGLALALPLALHAQGHEHGAARLDIALDAGSLTLQLEAPLESLFGFERAPRSAAERERVGAAIARLNAADTLWRPDPAGGCALAGVELTSAVLGLGAAPPGTPGDHADLDANIVFRCRDAARVAYVDSQLFTAFAALQRIDVRVAAPAGQFRRTLKRPAARIVLTR
jgi:Protein of unknown function (DUF2796)